MSPIDAIIVLTGLTMFGTCILLIGVAAFAKLYEKPDEDRPLCLICKEPHYGVIPFEGAIYFVHKERGVCRYHNSLRR